MFYCNALGIVPTGAMAIKELSMDRRQMFTAGTMMDAVMGVGLSCVMGLALTFFAFETRSVLSGTRFVLLGNICKLLSILANMAIWNLHAGWPGLMALVGGVLFGAMYQEPKLKDVTSSTNPQDPQLKDTTSSTISNASATAPSSPGFKDDIRRRRVEKSAKVIIGLSSP